MHPCVHCSAIYNSRDLEAAQVPISRRVDKKLWDIYTVEYCSAIKEKDLLPFSTARVDLEIVISETSQAEKDKCHMIPLMCGI